MSARTLFALIVAAGASALAGGCGPEMTTLRVVGDRPADVYVQRATVPEATQERSGVKPEFQYIGRTSAVTQAKGLPKEYVLNYGFGEDPKEMVTVRVQAADTAWDFKVFPAEDESVRIHYPPVGAGKGAWPSSAAERPSTTEPAPARLPKELEETGE